MRALILSIGLLATSTSFATEQDPLHWPSGENICTGRWAWQKYKTCKDENKPTSWEQQSSSACGEPTGYHQRRALCEDPNGEVDYYNRKELSPRHYSDFGRVFRYDVADRCRADISARLGRNETILDIHVYDFGVENTSEIGTSFVKAKCKAVIGLPVYKKSRHSGCEFEDDPHNPIYPTCNDPARPIAWEHTTREECGLHDHLNYTPLAQPKSTIRDGKAVKCTTTDEIPAEGNARQKFDALREAIELVQAEERGYGFRTLLKSLCWIKDLEARKSAELTAEQLTYMAQEIHGNPEFAGICL